MRFCFDTISGDNENTANVIDKLNMASQLELEIAS